MTEMAKAPAKPLSRELAAWLERRQSMLTISKTTATPHGQTLDWVPIESQVARGRLASPPPGGASPGAIGDRERPTQRVVLERVEDGPADHVPILRPDLSRLVGKRSLDVLFAKRGGLFANARRRAGATPADPNPAGYFHCTTAQWATAYGCEAWLNCWDPVVDIPSSPGDDHSISQTWLQNYHTGTTQSLEAGLTVDHNLNGDAANHLFTYYTTNGYASDGDNRGGYNRLQQGWVQYHASIFPGIRINGSSTLGGTQLELGIKFQLFQGNWWFGIDNSGSWTWIGYYPASLFAGAGGIADHAEWVSFGGEVYSALADPCGTTDQMGSGRKAAAGWMYAAYQRNLRYQSAASGTVSDFDGSAETDVGASGCPTGTYTIDTFMESGSSWDSYQFWGGPADRLESPTVPGHAHVSPVSRSADHLDVFVTDAGGAIYTAAWEPDFTDWWHGWWTLNGGAAAPGAPVHAVSRSTDKLDAFVIGTDDHVYTAAWEPDFTDWWHGWWQLNGGVAAPGAHVTAVSRSRDHLDVFVVGTDGGVYTAAWEPDFTDWWHGWWRIGNVVAPQGAYVGAVSRSADKLDIFVTDVNGVIQTAAWEPANTDGWHGWWELNGGRAAPGAPVTAVSRSTDKLDVFVTGTDGGVYTAAWEPDFTDWWHGWWRIGGLVAPQGAYIGAVSRSQDKLDIFATDAAGVIQTAAWEPANTDGWHGWWELNGGRAAPGAPVTAVSRSTDKLDVFVVGTDSKIYTAAWEPDFTDWWHGWWRMG